MAPSNSRVELLIFLKKVDNADLRMDGKKVFAFGEFWGAIGAIYQTGLEK